MKLDKLEEEMQSQAINERNEEASKATMLKHLELEISNIRKQMDDKDEQISSLSMNKTQLTLSLNET